MLSMPRFAIGLLAVAGALVVRPVAAAEGRAADEQAIRAAAKAYHAALAKGDAKALAAAWTADGQYIDADGVAHAAAELEAELEAAGQRPPQTKITSSAIRFLTAEVAIEDGTSEVALSGEPPISGHYHATWIKQDGRWRLAHLCELATPAGAASPLDELAWLIGDWKAAAGDVQVTSTVRWGDEGDYLLRETEAQRDGKLVLQSTQRIGIDPLSGQLKSWSFDTAGGHAEAVWTRDGNSWVEQATGVLPDGRATTGTAILTPEGDQAFVRKLLAARIDGRSSPDQELKFTRQPAAEK